MIIAIVNRKRISYSTEKFGSTGLAIAAFMFALTLIIDAVMQYKTVFDTATDSAIMYGTESVQYLKRDLFRGGSRASAPLCRRCSSSSSATGI